MGYFYSTQKGVGDSVGAHSYRATSREKVTSAMDFMAQTRHPEQCALTGWLYSLGSISHVGHLQWKAPMLGKVAICQRKPSSFYFQHLRWNHNTRSGAQLCDAFLLSGCGVFALPSLMERYPFHVAKTKKSHSPRSPLMITIISLTMSPDSPYLTLSTFIKCLQVCTESEYPSAERPTATGFLI